MPVPLESLRTMVSGIVPPVTTVVTPLTVNVVPTTFAMFELLRLAATLAVTVIVRLRWSPPAVRRAVAVPVGPVVPLVT